MKRFRVYDKWLHETLEQSDTNDYSYRDKENMWICDITDALEDPTRFVVQENTGIKDIRHNHIFEGDKVGFTEDVFGLAVSRKGTVVRSDTGMWQVMVDETPVEFKGVEIESNILRDTILVKGNIEPTYQERQAEIEDLMEKIENSPRYRPEGITHLHGKPIEDFTQSALYTHLKGLWEALQ